MANRVNGRGVMLVALLAGAAPAMAVTPGYPTLGSPTLDSETSTAKAGNDYGTTSAGKGGANASIDLQPQPRLTASVNIGAGDTGVARADLTYQFGLDPASLAGMDLSGQGSFTQQIRIDYSGDYHLPVTLPGYTGYSEGEIKIFDDPNSFAYLLGFSLGCQTNYQGQIGTCGPTSGTKYLTYNLADYNNNVVTYHNLYVFEEASAYVDGGGAAYAMTDPVFSIADSSTLSLRVSPGVGNTSALAAVPEPATWAMMLAGFGVAGGRLRRQRKARAPVAA